MVGILTEKPSAGQDFATALGGKSGTYNGEKYVIVSARGHLYEFAPPEQQVAPAKAANYKSWDVGLLPWDERDFNWKRLRKKDTAAVLKTIKDVLGQCDEIAIATDDDPTGEGELLAWEILDELRLVRGKKISRMFFVDQAPKSIQAAFVSRKPIASMETDMDYVKAFYRSRWDFMSMQFTRLATMLGDGKSVLRQGRLKSAMVLLVGDGLKAYANYKKTPSYQNRFRDENGVMYSNPDEPSFPNKSQVQQSYQPSLVVIDSTADKTTAPPALLSLASLSAMLSTKGVKAKTVLDVYQKMYEARVVSYPRTEDKFITPEQFDEMLPYIDKIARVVGVDPGILTHRTPRKTHVKTGCAHGANRPGTTVPNSLDELAKFGSCAAMIYETLARNYLAMLAEDYEYKAQKGHLANYPAFTGSTTIPGKPGWKAVFNAEDDDDAGDMNSKGLGTNASPFVHEGFPPKPPAPTQKWLMKQLEKRNVGTGATQTSIFADVTNEKATYPLLGEKKGKLTMTEYGTMSYLMLPGTHIGDLATTEQLQEDMKAIAEGRANPEQLLAKMKQMVLDDIEAMRRNGENMRKECGKTMATFEQKEKYTGIWNGKEVSFNRTFRGKRLSDDECARLCAGEEIEITGLKSQSGSEYGVIGALANLTYNGHKYVGVEQKGFVQNKGIPAVWCGHVFTEDEKILMQQGNAVELSDCVSKKTGKTFSCRMSWTADDGLKPEFG